MSTACREQQFGFSPEPERSDRRRLAGEDGPLAEPELVPVQTLQRQQAQQEAEPVTVQRPGALQEEVKVPGIEAEPAQRVSIPVPVYNSHGPQRARRFPAGAHRHLREDSEQEERPGREAEEGGGGEEGGDGAAAENVSKNTRNVSLALANAAKLTLSS